MKLYTEEQVIDIFQKYGNMSEINARNIIDLSESIKIPNDEEIDENVTCSNLGLRYDFSMNSGFKKGAKWMRDKIQGGNNEESSSIFLGISHGKSTNQPTENDYTDQPLKNKSENL